MEQRSLVAVLVALIAIAAIAFALGISGSAPTSQPAPDQSYPPVA